MARATKTLGELPNDALIVDPYTTIYGNPIVWHKVSDKSSKTTLRTDKIIKIAAFDAREPSNPEPDYTSPTTPMPGRPPSLSRYLASRRALFSLPVS